MGIAGPPQQLNRRNPDFSHKHLKSNEIKERDPRFPGAARPSGPPNFPESGDSGQNLRPPPRLTEAGRSAETQNSSS